LSVHHEGAAYPYLPETLAAELANRLPVAVAAWLPNEVPAVGSRRGLARKRRERADTELQSDMPTTVSTPNDEGTTQ
jgi:hypothetical protein